MNERFDAIVLGAGPAGETAVNGLARAGLRVALVERELIGGECGYWACIPSKTLLRPPEARSQSERVAGLSRPELDWPSIAAYRDWMIRNLDDTDTVARYQERGITIIKAAGRIAGPGRIQANGHTLQTERIILATGSDPLIPPIEGLKDTGYWTNRETTTLAEIPASAVILGGGPVGIELAQLLARYGAQVTIVQAPSRLINREDPKVSTLIATHLKEDGIDLRLGREAKRVRPNGSEHIVTLDDGDEVQAEQVIIATGRKPRTHDIGLETIDLTAAPNGIPIDERCRATDGVWAIGDLTGVAMFTHVGKYQARIAVADILGQGRDADYRAVPRVVFSDPEIAAVGLTQAQARDQGHDIQTATVDLAQAIARPYTYEKHPRGTLGIITDQKHGTLIGAWAVAPLASEWIHLAALAIKANIPLTLLEDTIAQFPTYTEGYLTAIRKLQ